MEKALKKYPEVGACGLECGLCPRYYSDGASRCPGCCGEGFGINRGCGFIGCCVRRKNLETCAQCDEWSGCARMNRNLNTKVDSFISYKPLAQDLAFMREHGVEEFIEREKEKMSLLKHLLDNYNEGRSKGFYCLAVQLLPLDELRKVVAQAEKKLAKDTDIKEKARLVRGAIEALAGKLDIDLKLRKQEETWRV